MARSILIPGPRARGAALGWRRRTLLGVGQARLDAGAPEPASTDPVRVRPFLVEAGAT